MPNDPHPPRPSLQKLFLTGLLTLLPIFLAGFVLWLTGRTVAEQLPRAH